MLEERPSNRPGRSNSLQRMLDLEKHFMIQRLQALDPNGAPTTYRSHPPVARSHIQARRPDFPPQHSSRASSRSPQRASFSAQRPPLVIQVDSARPSMTSTAEQYASLIDEIRISDSIADPDKPSPKVVAFQFPPDFEDRKSVCQSPSWEAYDRRKKERKDEKNERKEEKRKQEELRRERKKEEERKREMEKREQQNASRKPRRLSKPPPVTAQTQAQIQAAASNTPPVPRTQKPRPASVLGITFPSSHHDDGAERSSRKRSGSFTSLIRAPFEVRRASFDHARDAGFIGGIKLEQERFDAQQRADEANIHPALRKPKFDSRSSSPLRSPNTPSGRGNADSTQRRAYPPITILTASSKTRSLAAPDLSRMEKLRARVGLKPGTKNDKIERDAQSTGAPEANSTTASNASLPKYESDGEKKTSKMKEFMVPHSPSLAPEPLRLRTDKSNNTKRNINEKSLNIRIPHKDEGRSPQISAKSSPMTPKDHTPHSATKPTEGEPTLSELMAQDRVDGRDAALLLPPLRPPRKSSKRSLATNSSASSPSTATPRVQVAPSPSAASETPHNLFGLFDGAYTPPSLELNVPDEKTPAVAPKPRVSGESPRFADSDMRGNSLGIVSNHNSRPSQPSRVESSERPSIDKGIAHTSDSRSTKREKPTGRRPAKDNGAGDRTLRSLVLSSSSEDSSSDELQFHSPLSTPGTSRPQSEKELTPVPTDTELGPTLGERRKSTQLKHQVTQEDLAPPSAHSKQHHRKSSYHSDIEEDIELDRIQAAARKVMAAFPGNAPPVPPLPSSSRKDRRTQSDPDVASSAGFLPKLKLQQLKRKDKSKLGQVTSPSELDKDDTVREQLLGATIKAKSAVHLPQATKSQTHLSPPSPGLSPMSLPTPTFHRRSRSSISSPEASSKPLLSHTSRPSMDSHRSTGVDGTNAPVAKMFVECCGCKYYHDMPSRLYETMVNEDALMAPADAVEFKGSKAMTVRCPWCQHDMSTKCCAGLAAMVYVKERLH